MTNNLDSFVADNHDRIRSVGARFVEVDSNRNRDFSFGPTTITVDVEATVYKRTTGSQIVFGHHDDDHGFGRGTFGDDRGSWVEAGTTDTIAQFTKAGRRAVVRALDGQEGAVTSSKAGVGSSDPATSDEALTGVYSDEPTSNKKTDSSVVRSSGIHDAASWVGDPVEFGIFDGEDRLLARVVVDGDWGISTDDDVRLDVTLSFEGEGIGKSVFTEDGEESVADAMAYKYDASGPAEFAFGSGEQEFEKSDSSLTSEEFRKANGREINRDQIVARTHVFESEPEDTEQPVDISEMAVFNDDGRMIWATRLRTYTKREDAGFNAESEFRVS